MLQTNKNTLKWHESGYRSIIEAIKDPVYVCSPEQRILYMNPAMEAHLGRNATGEICYQAFYGEKKRCTHCVFDQVIQGQAVEYELNDPVSRKHFIVLNTPIVNIDNSISKLTVLRDITLFKELQTQNAQSQRMETLGTLAGGIAHDFNNILTIINGNTAMLMRSGANPGTEIHEQLLEIERAGKRAADLVRQLLTFSRKQTVYPQILNLDHALEEIQTMLMRLICEGIEVKMISCPDGPPMVEIDPGQIEQVMMNLAVNAMHAMPQGGALTFKTARVELDMRYFESHDVEAKIGSYICLLVSDTGVGMDKETSKRIFEPFFTTKDVGQGTGLGLSSVYGIMKQNNGFIWVYSEPGLGTTFKLYFPESKNKASLITKPVMLQDTCLEGSETILLVEDDAPIRNLCLKMLREFGYNVLEASSGKVALEILQENFQRVDLMITDVIMSGMGGEELVLKVREFYPHIKILYISGHIDNVIRHCDLFKKREVFLEKPFTPQELAKKIRELL
ncbi:ATP-binding protein [Desulfocicer vacuolatum]|nr:ATP-binding protein [Desulfocicer vacuolatum]